MRGLARVDRRTKEMVARLQPGEVAVVNHPDLDRVAAESLMARGIVAVVNAEESLTGRYPNTGPLLLVQAGIRVLDGVGPAIMDDLAEGTTVELVDDAVMVDGQPVAHGTVLTEAVVLERLEAAKATMGDELERFAANTLAYIQTEGHLLIDDPDVPDVPVDIKGRHVLIVVRGIDYKDDLAVLRASGYLNEVKPLLIGVDGAADALLELGLTPDVIIGDFDSVSDRAIGCGAVLVAHGYKDGHAPAGERIEELGHDYVVFSSEGTSEDIAMLLAFERGAELIVAVGTHSSMAEFLDKGRGGMASTFLVRMKVGPVLVDAKGVSRLYRSRLRKRDLLLLVASALVTLFVIALTSEPIRVLVKGLLLPLD
ncbi:MAG: putative cytokinetic ring protein SteA [Iamia sp.]